jgi:hypothetical protein
MALPRVVPSPLVVIPELFERHVHIMPGGSSGELPAVLVGPSGRAGRQGLAVVVIGGTTQRGIASRLSNASAAARSCHRCSPFGQPPSGIRKGRSEDQRSGPIQGSEARTRREKKLAPIQVKHGLSEPGLPAGGWLTVGRLDRRAGTCHSDSISRDGARCETRGGRKTGCRSNSAEDVRAGNRCHIIISTENPWHVTPSSYGSSGSGVRPLAHSRSADSREPVRVSGRRDSELRSRRRSAGPA